MANTTNLTPGQKAATAFTGQTPKNALDLFGIPVVVSPYLIQEPFRRHKKRRSQSHRYHSRIQKKWIKRYGMVDTSFITNIDGREILVISAPVERRLRELL